MTAGPAITKVQSCGSFSNKYKMILALLTFFTGIAISSIAIYYSVLGLASIFNAAATSVIIMGTVLEISKLVTAWWLKANWHRTPWTLKSYLTIAVITLMFITSMGIFGYLSKAHSDQNLVSGDVLAKISLIDEKIKIARANIDSARAQLRQLDAAVDQVMSRSVTEQGAARSDQIRRSQANDRKRLLGEIEKEQNIIQKLNEDAAPIRAEVRQVEAEVGPIKYIAALVYGEDQDRNLLEKAVVWVILIIVFVFDPLAVLLLLASQMSFQWVLTERKENNSSLSKIDEEIEPKVTEEAMTDPKYEPDDGPLTNQQIEQLQATASKPVEPVVQKTDIFVSSQPTKLESSTIDTVREEITQESTMMTASSTILEPEPITVIPSVPKDLEPVVISKLEETKQPIVQLPIEKPIVELDQVADDNLKSIVTPSVVNIGSFLSPNEEDKIRL